MKIAEMNTEQLARCMADLAVPVANILDDGDTIALVDKLADMKDKSVLESASLLVRSVLPIALSRHADDTFAIVAALTGKSKETIRKQRGLLTIKEAYESFDGELVDFFKSSGTTV